MPGAEVFDSAAGATRQSSSPTQGEHYVGSLPRGQDVRGPTHVQQGIHLPHQQEHGGVQRTVRVGPSGTAWVTVQPRVSADPVRAPAHSPRPAAEQHDRRERVASWLAGSSSSCQGGRMDAADRSVAGHEHARRRSRDTADTDRRPSWRSRSPIILFTPCAASVYPKGCQAMRVKVVSHHGVLYIIFKNHLLDSKCAVRVFSTKDPLCGGLMGFMELGR